MIDSIQLNRTIREPLLEIRKRGCAAYIAGGAIRDTICKRPINDIDVFIWHFSFDNHTKRKPKNWEGAVLGDTAHTWLQRIFVDGSSWDCDSIYELTNDGGYATGTINPHIYSPILESYINGTKYQFIFTKPNPLDYIKNHFDFDLCRAWCDGHKLSVGTPFINDWTGHKLTLAGQLTKEEYYYALQYHAPRLKLKYPDYAFCIDPHLKATYGS